MATCTTAQFGNKYCPQFRLSVTSSRNTDTSTEYSWKVEYIAHGYEVMGSKGMKYTATIDGAKVKEATFDPNGITGTKTVASGTKTISKGTSKRTISFKISADMNLIWHGVQGNTKTASGSTTLSAKTSYTVSYNSNGGSGAPGSQTKWHGTNLILSSITPSRTGYKFMGWSIAKDTSVEYQPKSTYSSNSSVTLYAVWTPNKYTVSYNANGGVGAPSSQTKTYGVSLTLSSTIPSRINYTFLGWGTSASSTTVSYAPGSVYSGNSSISLYAIWKLAYISPSISKFIVIRSDSVGNSNETGTYCSISADWKTFSPARSAVISYKNLATGSITEAKRITLSGTSGNISTIIGGSLSEESSYAIIIKVEDSTSSASFVQELASIDYTIDFLHNGRGISFGRPSVKEGFHCYMESTFYGLMQQKRGKYTHTFENKSDYRTYIKFLTLKIKDNWRDEPIIFDFVSRQSQDIFKLILIFKGDQTVDPAIEYFNLYDINNLGIKFFIVKDAASSWSLYAEIDPWERITITDIVSSFKNLRDIDFNWVEEVYTYLPYGNQEASKVGDSGWVNCPLSSGYSTYKDQNPLQVRRNGKIVEIRGVITNNSMVNWTVDGQVVAALPNSSFYPSGCDIKVVQQGSKSNRFLSIIKTNGNIVFERYSNNTTTSNDTPANSWLNCFATWLVE